LLPAGEWGSILHTMDTKQSARATRERGPVRPVELFTASDLARFCQVDLKTIHNWSEKGEIPHFRTPGRHLRFRRLDVLDFLRKYGYSIPEALRTSKPRLVVVESDSSALQSVKRALSKRFDISGFHDPYDALIALSTLQPEALIIDLELTGFDVLRLLSRLRTLDATAHIRTIVYTKRTDVREKALAAGATDVVAKDDVAGLREALEKMMGLGGER
jgi:excisionase family DNA binding protein